MEHATGIEERASQAAARESLRTATEAYKTSKDAATKARLLKQIRTLANRAGVSLSRVFRGTGLLLGTAGRALGAWGRAATLGSLSFAGPFGLMVGLGAALIEGIASATGELGSWRELTDEEKQEVRETGQLNQHYTPEELEDMKWQREEIQKILDELNKWKNPEDLDVRKKKKTKTQREYELERIAYLERYLKELIANYQRMLSLSTKIRPNGDLLNRQLSQITSPSYSGNIASPNFGSYTYKGITYPINQGKIAIDPVTVRGRTIDYVNYTDVNGKTMKVSAQEFFEKIYPQLPDYYKTTSGPGSSIHTVKRRYTKRKIGNNAYKTKVLRIAY